MPGIADWPSSPAPADERTRVHRRPPCGVHTFTGVRGRHSRTLPLLLGAVYILSTRTYHTRHTYGSLGRSRLPSRPSITRSRRVVVRRSVAPFGCVTPHPGACVPCVGDGVRETIDRTRRRGTIGVNDDDCAGIRGERRRIRGIRRRAS
jgi:hypothetical protein